MSGTDVAAAISRRLRDERGMTLVELLAAMVIGGIVISAAIMLVVMSMRASVRVSDRVNAAAVGRSGMELITQRVRSQTCLFPGEYSINGTVDNANGQNSILFAGPTGIAFLADIGNTGGATNVAGSVGYVPRIHYVLATPRSNGARGSRIVAGTKAATTSTKPFNWTLADGSATTFDGLASTSGIAANLPTNLTSLADGVTQAVSTTGVAQPFFQYYDDDNIGATGTAMALSSGALPLASLANIARVSVAFTVLGESGIDKAAGSVTGATALDNRTATYQSDVSFRTDPDACG